MLALLMGRDSNEVKSHLFLEAVLGRDALDAGKTNIAPDHIGLKRAIKLINYFSEIFPKQYFGDFLDDINKDLVPDEKVNQIRETYLDMPVSDF